jgi:hypothetical protein
MLAHPSTILTTYPASQGISMVSEFQGVLGGNLAPYCAGPNDPTTGQWYNPSGAQAMAKPLEQLEGILEELLARSPELASRRVRLTVLDTAEEPAKAEKPEKPPVIRKGNGLDLFETAVGWAGDDLEECLEIMYNTRGKAKF